jgi:DNA-binding transcriptional ArsR family regulator
MARAATNTDAFNAVAEPRRRQIVELIGEGELSVNDIVDAMPISQPQVSKHLKVLKEVGLVTSRTEGRRRLYRLEASALRPIYDWVSEFERLWNERLDRFDSYLAEVRRKEHR